MNRHCTFQSHKFLRLVNLQKGTPVGVHCFESDGHFNRIIDHQFARPNTGNGTRVDSVGIARIFMLELNLHRFSHDFAQFDNTGSVDGQIFYLQPAHADAADTAVRNTHIPHQHVIQ